MEEIKEKEIEQTGEIKSLPESSSNENRVISGKTIDDLDNSREVENMRKIEAALFISGRWLSMQDLITLTDLNPILIRQLVDRLKERHNDFSAIEIINKDNEWKMDVKPEYVNMINKLATGASEFTKAQQETLAVIAYKQPVKQSVIIKIRGNKAYEHVHDFISLGLVKAKKVGHTHELTLSEDFYDYFHVDGKEENKEEVKSKE